MKNRSKKLVAKGIISSSLLLSMGGVFAHSIQSLHAHQSVPLSLTSTIILGILLIFTGLFILPRMQGRHIRTLATTTLLAGIIAAGVGGKLVSNTFAMGFDCNIDNLSSNSGCDNVPPVDFMITNNSDNEIVVTSIADILDERVQGKSRTLEIIELVKGSRKTPMQVQAVYSTCIFPQTLAPGEDCIFLHSQIFHGDID